MFVLDLFRPTAAVALKHRWLEEQLGCAALRASTISHTSALTDKFTKYLGMKKLKKAALGYIASKLTQAEVGNLEQLFKAMDKNGDGSITLTDLDEALAKGNFNADIQEDLRAMRHDLTVSDEDTINYKDFVAATMDSSLAMRDDNMKMAFEHFKHTDADYLTSDDLAEIFGDAHAQEMMHLLDTDGDDLVSYEDFRRVLAQSLEEDACEAEEEDLTEDGFMRRPTVN
jgi:calcium-dependent protein kinase